MLGHVEALLAEDDHAHLHEVPLDQVASCNIPLSEAWKPETNGSTNLIQPPLDLHPFLALQVARHNKPHDCWVALNGQVFDLTDFLLQHPEQRNAVLAWAGRDASAVWNKIPGRFPSANWMELLGLLGAWGLDLVNLSD